MVLENVEGYAAPARVGRAAKNLSRWRDILRFATAPSDAPLTVLSDVFMVFERDRISFEDRTGTPLPDADLMGKTADLILLDDVCYDLSLTLPAAPLAEFEAMITNEINFASPFPEDAAHAFWRANETAEGDWNVHIGVVLKSEAARARKAAADKGLILRRVVRLGMDDASEIYATPDWLTEAPASRARFNPALMLPAAALGVFVLSAGVQIGLTTLQIGTLRSDATAADQQLRQAASEMGFQRNIARDLTAGRQNIEILALLTAALPDDTWLDRVTLEEDTLRIIGYGPSGAETVRLLSALEGVKNPRAIGTVTRDNRQNVERFVIEFDLDRR